MDMPCAILILAFCMPETGLKLEVVTDGAGSTAVAKLGDVRASIVLSDTEEPASPAALEQRLCLGRACIPYAARFREDASSLELLIAAPDGHERFIQFKGPPDQIAAVSSRISYTYQDRGRWVFVPLSAFTASNREAF